MYTWNYQRCKSNILQYKILKNSCGLLGLICLDHLSIDVSGVLKFASSLVAQMVKCLLAIQETWVRSLEKEMATHSSTLAWKIPWMGEPGRLQSMGLQRVRHDWMTSLSHFCDTWSSSNKCGGHLSLQHKRILLLTSQMLRLCSLASGFRRGISIFSRAFPVTSALRSDTGRSAETQTLANYHRECGPFKAAASCDAQLDWQWEKTTLIFGPPWIPWGFMNLLGEGSCHSQELKF